MAKPKANLSGALDGAKIEPAPPPLASVPDQQEPKAGRPKRTVPTRLVGGQLEVRYSRALNILSAETGKTNRELLEEALDKLFVAYGARHVA